MNCGELVKNKAMRFCFTIIPVALAAANLNGAMMTTAVRVDPRSGRLVRSTLRPAGEKTPAPEVKKLAESIAAKHELEPLLVDSVIRYESNYDPQAVSPKGAMGLMQLIPATARRFGVSDTFHPEQNIEGGVKYLKYLMELYNGDEKLALAAYNAGEGAVARYKGVPPYPETQDYVRKISKRLGETRAERSAAAKPQPEPQVREPISVKFVDAEGREFYRTQ
jgi:soluble lytic murein transglycosylase-like protein